MLLDSTGCMQQSWGCSEALCGLQEVKMRRCSLLLSLLALGGCRNTDTDTGRHFSGLSSITKLLLCFSSLKLHFFRIETKMQLEPFDCGRVV